MSAIFHFMEDWIGTQGEEGLDAALWAGFGRVGTVLVVDMAGFTLRSKSLGITHYLALIRRMRLVADRLLPRHEGELVRFEADNLFATFEEPTPALAFTVALLDAVNTDNAPRDEADQVHLCAGLDHGAFLADRSDFFGDPVNMASKLGEDLARPNEVLVTQAIVERVSAEWASAFEEIGTHEFAGSLEPTYRLRR